MEDTWVYILSATSLLFLLYLFKLQRSSKRNLPPAPPSLPIIGHLHLIKEPVHRTLQSLSDRYGPVLSLSLGSRPAVVISSVRGRGVLHQERHRPRQPPRTLAGEIMAYGNTNIGTAPYGPHWRNLRRLTAVEILSPHRLTGSLAIRQEEVRHLMRSLYEAASSSQGGGFARVEMSSRLQEMSFNIIMRMISGKRYSGAAVDAGDAEVAREYRELIKEEFELSGTDPGDFLPVLRKVVDFKGRERRMVDAANRSDVILQGMIDEHRSRRKRSDADGSREEESKTMIETMLSEGYSDDIIKGQINSIIGAGTDTSAVTIEWAMSLLLNHLDVMKKAQVELDDIVGRDRLVDEADTHKLPCLHNIINEALRLFPPAPLLVPHESAEDCTIGGFDVPRGTMIPVNAWAIRRDPKVWDDPTNFKPERYDGLEGDHAYRLLPFGMGRRSCPVLALPIEW
ncbi:isoflavone 3'-hydroxylase [Eucalyptus grandis]|uniref:isoflavone 3'-hydroxylase n=1 Tax=Eucalyptus grandis TaxID=71139 RepID=UPI00192EFBC1|nr:isoflavone 3'-hydroxylase [Eucalyptus grandis]